ncbi:MAG: hypothetical protein N2559_16850, partial [Anaerolineae bacterium]|nr:hypothetical protein [Anaerolineae bacterium]
VQYKRALDDINAELPPTYRDTVQIPFTNLRINPELGFNPLVRWQNFIEQLQDPTLSGTQKALSAFGVLSPIPAVEAGVRGIAGEESLAQKTGRIG